MQPHSISTRVRLYCSIGAAVLFCLPTPSSAQITAAVSSPFEAEIAAFEKRDREKLPEPGGVLFIGSSSFRMWTDLEISFPKVHTINRGFGGSAIPDSTQVIDRIVTPYKPRMVVMYAGDNDIAAGHSADRVAADFFEFASKVRERLPEVKIAFVSIKPSPSRWKLIGTIKAANAKIKSGMRRQKRMVYINVFDAMLNDEGLPRPELYREDGLHPTAECYALWQKIIAPFVR